jgi:hypothetical protein
MNYKGVLKRLLPFAATFAVAVFITSFFVDLSASRFGNWRARRWERRCSYERMMRENEQLRNENLRLRNELRNQGFDMDELNSAVPPPPLPPAPVAPRFR